MLQKYDYIVSFSDWPILGGRFVKSVAVQVGKFCLQKRNLVCLSEALLSFCCHTVWRFTSIPASCKLIDKITPWRYMYIWKWVCIESIYSILLSPLPFYHIQTLTMLPSSVMFDKTVPIGRPLAHQQYESSIVHLTIVFIDIVGWSTSSLRHRNELPRVRIENFEKKICTNI